MWISRASLNFGIRSEGHGQNTCISHTPPACCATRCVSSSCTNAKSHAYNSLSLAWSMFLDGLKFICFVKHISFLTNWSFAEFLKFLSSLEISKNPGERKNPAAMNFARNFDDLGCDEFDDSGECLR